MTIRLDTIDKVKNFVNDINKVECDVFLKNGVYAIDAKSIMGIFSLNLSQPLIIEAEKESDVFTKIVKKYQ